MSNYWVDGRFIKKFEELQRAVGGSVSGSSNSKYNHYSDSNQEIIQVEISSIVSSPESGSYTENSTIQFVGRQVLAADDSGGSLGRLNFDSTISNKLDTIDRFDLDNLYGVNIEFDSSDPTANEADFKDKTFSAYKTTLKVKNDSGDFEFQEVWSIQPAGEVSTNIYLCTITADNGGSKYNVDVTVGNPLLIGTVDPSKGILHLTYSTTDPVAIGASIMAIVYPNTTNEAIKFDCFPIETTMNLVALPEEGGA